MGEALRLAREAAIEGEVPVGAVVLDANGNIIGRGRNRREIDDDPLAHAEVEAMRDAATRLGAAANRLTSNKNDTNTRSNSARDWDSASKDDMLFVPASTNARPRSQKGWNLADCTLVVTLEPCPMCAGAALQTHIGRIVFGAWDEKLGACGSVWDIPRDPHIGAQPEVFGGVREQECAQLLTDFFSAKR
ncbi:nucleoside deaminase [Bifidobacterium sp. ESL0790]|nr:nucleoside deaminase [Bifidobacterium sp. ESL0790]WEV73271.1 nucleoside deaminase [Bifidobacterium sp. ESL0790]